MICSMNNHVETLSIVASTMNWNRHPNYHVARQASNVVRGFDDHPLTSIWVVFSWSFEECWKHVLRRLKDQVGDSRESASLPGSMWIVCCAIHPFGSWGECCEKVYVIGLLHFSAYVCLPREIISGQ